MNGTVSLGEVLKDIGFGFSFAVLFFVAACMAVPWMVFLFEEYWPHQLRFDLTMYWSWCAKKQAELKYRRKKKLGVV